MTNKTPNADLVANPFDHLAMVIANFDHAKAPDDERAKCVDAVKLIAEEVVRRYKDVSDKQAELDRRLANLRELEKAHKAFGLLAGTGVAPTRRKRLLGLF